MHRLLQHQRLRLHSTPRNKLFKMTPRLLDIHQCSRLARLSSPIIQLTSTTFVAHNHHDIRIGGKGINEGSEL